MGQLLLLLLLYGTAVKARCNWCKFYVNSMGGFFTLRHIVSIVTLSFLFCESYVIKLPEIEINIELFVNLKYNNYKGNSFLITTVTHCT